MSQESYGVNKIKISLDEFEDEKQEGKRKLKQEN